MITKRNSHERGQVKLGWLNAHHSFSFGSYFDPKWMGFSKLRVINDDFIAPGGGFPTHPHNNMEIITFVLSGAIEHKDTLGSHAKVVPGEIQVMSAGTGVEHSEFNPNGDKSTNLLQIWIEPKLRDIKPRYEQIKYTKKTNELVLIAAPNGDNIAKINQDAYVYIGKYESFDDSIKLEDNSNYWIHCYEGSFEMNSETYSKGDGAAIENESEVSMKCDNCEFLLFKLP